MSKISDSIKELNNYVWHTSNEGNHLRIDGYIFKTNGDRVTRKEGSDMVFKFLDILEENNISFIGGYNYRDNE